MRESQGKDTLQILARKLTELIKLSERIDAQSTTKQNAPLAIKLVPNSDRIQLERLAFANESVLK
jgi:hypothetical protein